MILTSDEVERLIGLQHSNPHQLLGMHVLGSRGGVVVRAMIPDADKVVAVPVHEKKLPSIPLERVHEAGLFEGVEESVDHVFAYDLVVTDKTGRKYSGRDPYSFWPTVEEGDLFLFAQGNERRIYRKLGAHPRTIDGVPGVSFAVWAPNARRVSVVGDFNQWDGRRHTMRMLGGSGIWEVFIPGCGKGAHYKYEIHQCQGALMLKTDPFGAFFERPPKNAAIVWDDSGFDWSDDTWLEKRAAHNPFQEAMSIYELHLGSWRKKSASESLSYRELAGPLVEYLQSMGFTHVEFLPVAEHAYYPSWGYQVTGFFAPTSRYGTPDDFRFLVNELHRAGIGVLVDWVPAHFPRDSWALARFDGTALFEHEDPRKGAHMDWGTLIFNYGRHEVSNFLVSNALYWIDQFHIDGLRVDAVASMLYLDYSRQEGEWLPNQYGGRENLEAIEFLRKFNHAVHTEYPGVVTVAEESTDWPQVTRPPYLGGLGFTFKWNMGWMHDTLEYFSLDPIYRKYHHNELTFAMVYQYHENFLLPLSHDEVVHGKRSIHGRMPGDDWQRFANLRVLFAYQWMFPGKKLLFMGGEFGQTTEWNENGQIAWHLLEQGPFHAGLQRLIADLNRFYLNHSAVFEADYEPEGFFWLESNDYENSVFSFVRQTRDGRDCVLVIMNLTPVPRECYHLGVPREGVWREVLNTDSSYYCGSNLGNSGGVESCPEPSHNQSFSADFLLPPLSVVVFQPA